MTKNFTEIKEDYISVCVVPNIVNALFKKGAFIFQIFGSYLPANQFRSERGRCAEVNFNARRTFNKVDVTTHRENIDSGSVERNLSNGSILRAHTRQLLSLAQIYQSYSDYYIPL